MALAGEKNACAIIDAGRDFHGHGFFVRQALLPAASRAWMCDDGTGAAALGAGAADAEKSLLKADLSTSAASGAGFRLASGFRSRTSAALASDQRTNLDLFSHTEDRLFKFQRELFADVG